MSIDQWILLGTIFAIVLSPIVALTISSHLSNRKEKRDRKYEILRSLMATRRARLDVTHVGALNLIELEFYDVKSVIDAYRAYVDQLSTPPPDGDKSVDAFLEKRNTLFVALLASIADSLNYRFDKSDLEKTGYQPEAFVNHFDNQMSNTQLLRLVLEGRRAIPISNFVKSDGIFPPSPDQ